MPVRTVRSVVETLCLIVNEPTVNEPTPDKISTQTSTPKPSTPKPSTNISKQSWIGNFEYVHLFI